jgi:hypothetical protein
MTRKGGGTRAMEYRNSPRATCIFGITSCLIWIVLQGLIALPVAAQTQIPLQPFAQQVRQVETSLAYLGQPLAQNDADAINRAIGNADRPLRQESHVRATLRPWVLRIPGLDFK